MMDNEYGNDFITLTDENGNEVELEHLDTFEMNDEVYAAFFPADMNEDDDDFGVVILKVIEEDYEELLIDIENETELNAAFELFLEGGSFE